MRFAIIGGFGVIINDGALWVFKLFISFYPVSYVCAFLISNGVNFFLNQTITYPENRPKEVRLWVQRFFKAQLTSASALLISLAIALICHYVFHVNEFISNPLGIAGSLTYKYLVSDKFVYRSKEQKDAIVPLDPMTPPSLDESVAS